MTNSINNPDGPRRLNDEELDSVTGGASWEVLMENDAYPTYEIYRRDSRQFKNATFEEFLQYFYRNHPDYLKCREAWIAAGKPENLSFSMGRDGVITSKDFPGASLIRR